MSKYIPYTDNISIKLMKEEKEKWKEIAKGRGITLSQLVREVVNGYIKVYEMKQEKGKG